MAKQSPVSLRCGFPFNYDTNAASDESGLYCDDPSLAQQSGKEDADINVIVKRFGITGQLPTNVNMPMSMDFEGIFDYHTAMNLITSAQQGFMEMPADIRSEFNNDPGAFVDFVSKPENRERAEKLGLVLPRAPEPDAAALAASGTGATAPAGGAVAAPAA